MAISQYDLTNYAQYKPLSTQEIWAPSQAMRQQHDQLQEEYANAEQAAQQGFSGLNPEVDKEALAIHKQFMDQTKAAADELATKGFIDSGRRRSLLKLKSVYTNQVAPLQQQIALRASRNEELRKMQLQDPTFRATANPNQVSLVSGLKNPNAFDYDGVSGNQLYSTAAKKLEQLSKTINQDVPELKKMPKLSFQYFTAIQSGATPDQAANAMKREGYDTAVVDKMTNMIHGTIDSTMREFGVYDKFKGNDKAINELWNSTSQAAYNAIGTKQFGQVHDSWSEAKATKKLNEAPPPNEQLMDEERFVPSFNKEGLSKINTLRENAKGNFKYNTNIKDTGESIASGSGRGNAYTGGAQKAQGSNNALLKAKKDEALNELNANAKQLGIKPFKSGVMDYNKWVDAVAGAMEERFKFSNKSKTISNIDKDVAGGIYSEVRGRNGGKLKDSEGNIFEVAQDSETNTVPSFDFNNGFVLSVPGKNGDLHEVPFKVEDLHISDLSRNYNLIRDVEGGKYQKSDLGFTNDQYENFKNSTAKAIRTRLSLKPGASVTKPKLGNE